MPTRLALRRQNSGVFKGEPTEADMARIRVPTLVIWGDKEAQVPLEKGERVKRAIPGARMAVISNVGHIPSIEKPVEFGRILTKFADER
jgi:pimeloyl-ACP methyl ester carboxylesterase